MTHRNANAKNHSSNSFQFTRPRGARLTLFPKLDYFIGFNSRARVGRDSTTFRPFMSCTKFQLTRPRGARLKVTSLLMVLYSFQFTRPRGARRIPTSVSSMVGCFNSRARVGRDQAMPRQASRAECFNSRARVGRDIIVVDGIIFPVVSIHAPAWGATALSGPNGNQWITFAFPRSY